MYASGSGLRWRSLEPSDRDALCALYPGTGGAPGCDVLSCPAGLVCVAGVCQRPHARADVCAPCTRVPGACEAAGDDARCIDIGERPTAGRVCGRACTADADCGAGFACRPTSDLQCVSLDGCRSAANTCATDADCTDSTCRGGVCVGPTDPVDAGRASDSGAADGGDASMPVDGDDGGCGCGLAGGGPAATAPWLLFALAVLAVRRRRR
jgi:MYXO-CTERM domain-containing protein